MFHFKLDGSETESPSGTDNGFWEFFVVGQPVLDFVTDNATEISTSHFLVISVADADATSSP